MTTIALPPDLEGRLKSLAKERGQTKTSLIQQALRIYLERQELLAIERKLQAKARAMGIATEDDVDRLIHEFRKQTRR